MKRKRNISASSSLNVTPAEVSVSTTPVAPIKTEYIPTTKKSKKISPGSNPYEKPPYSYMAMIQFAIESKGAMRKMTLKEIYDYIETKFPYFKVNLS